MGSAAAPRELNGTVTYLERIALPPWAEIVVSLLDVPRANAVARTIAQQQLTLGDNQVPVAFTLRYAPDEIDERLTYAVRAEIRLEERVAFTSTDAVLVLTQGHSTRDIEIMVRTNV